MTLPILDESVKGKKVLVRGDIDVPLIVKNGENGRETYEIGDDTRLKAIKPTIDFLLENNCQITFCGHVGRPEGKMVPELSTKPIQEWFGARVKVLENLRFDPKEEANDESLAKELASLADIYVDEAFATCERAHASIVGVPKLLPHYAGFQLAKEVEALSKVLENPQRPLVVIIGGLKLETKLPLISKMKSFADTLISNENLTQIPNTLDVTTKSVDQYEEAIAQAATIVWNGPFGKVEDFTYQVGTRRLAELIVSNTTAYKVVGGGDTVAFIDKLGLTNKFSWVSTGGGSMLKFLAGEKLPGIEALISG